MKTLMIAAALMFPTLSRADSSSAPDGQTMETRMRAERPALLAKLLEVDSSTASQIDAAMSEFDTQGDALMSQLRSVHQQIESVAQGSSSLSASQVDDLVSQAATLEDQLRQNSQAMYAQVSSWMSATQKARFSRLAHGGPMGGMPPPGGARPGSSTNTQN
jgi:hypothetical protein